MPKLSHTQLERRADTLVANGRQPAAQAVIAAVGCDLADLDEGAALLDAMRRSRAQRQTALAGYKEVARAQAGAYQAARREMVNLSETARTLFAADVPTLTALDLLPRYTHLDDSPGRRRRRAVRPSRSMAETLARWRLLLDNAAKLDGDLAAQLRVAGWPAERLAQAAALVEACAAALTARQAAGQARRQAVARFQADVEALRAWYARAARLIKIAIRYDDPASQAQLYDLLGLNL